MKYSLKFILILFSLFISLNDGMSTGLVSKVSGNPEILFIKDDKFSGQSLFYDDIIDLGYDAIVIEPDSVTLDKMNQFKLVILSTGNNPFACQNSLMRLALQSFILKFSGKVIIEGGHTGYISAVFPFYLGFRNKVIKIDDWVADYGGDIVISNSHTQSNLANSPNILPSTISINYVNSYYQDVCTNNKFSELFYGTSIYNNKVGILVAPAVNNPQVINYFVYYSAISNRTDAKKLLENSIFNLIGKPLAIDNSSEIIPGDFRLFQNYPNPFNPVTKISYSLSKSAFVSLKIVNILGSDIEVLVSKKQNSGNYDVYWDAENYSNGVYFCSFSVNGITYDTKRMLLLK